MKRYWRLMAIVTVVVLTIGAFYIQSALAANDLPDITIETVNGDADEMDPITIGGSYNVNGTGEAERVQIDKTGATYSSEQSLFQRLDGVFQERVKKLQEEHRGFMRGKSGSAVSYMETEEALAYADVNNQTVSQGDEAAFDIAVLDKESGETTSFMVPVPDRNMYNFSFVEDVQMGGDELIIITHNSTKDRAEEEHLYHVDIEEQTISRDETILSIDHSNADKKKANFNILTSDDKTAPREDILFRKTLQIPVSDGDQDELQGQRFETKTDGYMDYNLKTGKMKKLDTPEALPDQEPIGRDNTTLYFKNDEKMTAYNFEKGEITHKFNLPDLSSSSGAKDDQRLESVMRIKNDRVYILTQNNEAPQRLMVFDLTSGDTLYEGRLIFDDIEDNASMDLYNLVIES